MKVNRVDILKVSFFTKLLMAREPSNNCNFPGSPFYALLLQIIGRHIDSQANLIVIGMSKLFTNVLPDFTNSYRPL